MEVRFHNLDNVIDDFAKFSKVNNKAISQAMNRANTAGRTAVVSDTIGMRKKWNLKSGDLKAYTWSTKSNVNRLDTKFGMVSKSINLADFGAKWKRATPSGRKTKGVSYKIQKGKRKLLKGAFMAKGYVFTRRADDKIVPQFSITPTSMFTESDYDDLYIKKYFEMFDKRYSNNLDFLMSKSK